MLKSRENESKKTKKVLSPAGGPVTTTTVQMLHNHCAFFFSSSPSDFRRAARTLVHTSVYSSVPRKTTAVPSQCHTVKGFWKYITEMIRLRNFRRVTTRVTVSEAHSVVRMNTPRMHTYLEGAGCQGEHSWLDETFFFLYHKELPMRR